MNYQITIRRREANPNFAAEMEKFEESNGRKMYAGDIHYDRPQEEVTKNVLMCELTEEEYRKIKSEVFTTFK